MAVLGMRGEKSKDDVAHLLDRRADRNAGSPTRDRAARHAGAASWCTEKLQIPKAAIGFLRCAPTWRAALIPTHCGKSRCLVAVAPHQAREPERCGVSSCRSTADFFKPQRSGVEIPATDGPARLYAHALDMRVPPPDLSAEPPVVGGGRHRFGVFNFRSGRCVWFDSAVNCGASREAGHVERNSRKHHASSATGRAVSCEMVQRSPRLLPWCERGCDRPF
jgi:hypothetical protein